MQILLSTLIDRNATGQKLGSYPQLHCSSSPPCRLKLLFDKGCKSFHNRKMSGAYYQTASSPFIWPFYLCSDWQYRTASLATTCAIRNLPNWLNCFSKCLFLFSHQTPGFSVSLGFFLDTLESCFSAFTRHRLLNRSHALLKNPTSINISSLF